MWFCLVQYGGDVDSRFSDQCGVNAAVTLLRAARRQCARLVSSAAVGVCVFVVRYGDRWSDPCSSRQNRLTGRDHDPQFQDEIRVEPSRSDPSRPEPLLLR